MLLLKINPRNPQKRLIRKVVEVLQSGGIIGYPTDTIYGIGCDLFNKGAIERVYQIKKVGKNKPLSFICSDLKDLSLYAQVPNYAYRIMKKLLPGPYTFLLRASRLVPKIMLTKRKTVGIRVPDNAICLAIVKELGHPIISTSVRNREGALIGDPQEIVEEYGKRLDVVVDGGVIVPEHSSIIDLSDEEPKILRVGKGDVSYFS